MKKTQGNFEFFVYFIFPLIVLGLGLFGNIMGSILLTVRKNLSQIGPVNTYRYMLLTDCACLINTIIWNYFESALSIRFSALNDFACKTYKYMAYLLSSPSHLFLLYILVERFLVIKFPVESNLLQKKKFQLNYFITILVINIFYFMPILTYFNIQTKVLDNNSTIRSCECKKDSIYIIEIQLYFSRIFIPLLLIVLFSILLVYTIIKSKSRMSTFYTPRENVIFKKDINLSIMSIGINVLILSLRLPGIFLYYNLISLPDYFSLFFYYLFNCIYAFKFYFFFSFNSLFRQEFLEFCFRKNRSSVPKNHHEIEMLST